MPTRDQLRSFLDRLIELSIEYGGDPEIILVRGNFMGIYVADKISRSREEFLIPTKHDKLTRRLR